MGKNIQMTQQTIDLRVNPSDETIRLGPLAVRFLLTGDNSTGSIAAFELVVDPQECNGDHNCLERHPTSARADLIGCGTVSFNIR